MDIILFGVGQIAEVMAHYVEQDPDFNLVGFTVDRPYLPPSGAFKGLPVAAWDDVCAAFPPEQVRILGPVSYRGNNTFRRDRHLEAKEKGYRFASYIHPSSHVSGAEIGENSVILEDCTVQPYAKLGTGSILWSKVHIGHHAQVGNFCFFASFCGIAGNARIGDCTFFGGQTGLADNLSVGSGCIIGAGTVVTETIADGALAVARGGRVLPNGARRFARTLLG
ncbi:acetyltransferase [Rhodobacter maris]|uniref:Sugar O-acyltransferase (Sialic acid O-acetyltransferase NeuD family) n=1 Tax=Rhodobacter maris TaxID=446682 RepID=A0A285T2D9_9RHOB|nr:acetyltransferase [Rhodobacter maris]SOC15196.1 sugar O-acyltransferase (sialic acid O-acetyltransferase NeuD family) [Rhodobacter maris]